MKIGIVYWSGTGNTEIMAEALASGVKSVDAECEVFNISDGTPDLSSFDKCMYGCPAMGSEELEEEEFLPFWDDVKGSISGKEIVLFGSYEWADGEWMDTWKEEAEDLGAIVHTIIAYDIPDEESIEECKKLGASFAK